MVPFSTLSERLEYWARMTSAYCVMAILFVLNVITIPPPFSAAMSIPFILIMIYYWSTFRPTLIPVGLVFASGLVLDILSGAPLGLNALIFTAVNWLITDQRNVLLSQPFIMVWLGFSVLNALTLIAQWFIFGLLSMHWTSIFAIMPAFWMGIGAFPCICFILHLSHKILPEPEAPLMANNLKKI